MSAQLASNSVSQHSNRADLQQLDASQSTVCDKNPSDDFAWFPARKTPYLENIANPFTMPGPRAKLNRNRILIL